MSCDVDNTYTQAGTNVMTRTSVVEHQTAMGHPTPTNFPCRRASERRERKYKQQFGTFIHLYIYIYHFIKHEFSLAVSAATSQSQAMLDNSCCSFLHPGCQYCPSTGGSTQYKDDLLFFIMGIPVPRTMVFILKWCSGAHHKPLPPQRFWK